MNNAILKQKDRLVKLLSAINGIIYQEALLHREFIAELNKEQLMIGIDAEGKDMPDYIEGSLFGTGKINLKDTGDFHAGIQPLFDDLGIEMWSTDEKTRFLEPMYDALGLTQESKKMLRDKMKQGIINSIKQKL